MVSHPIRQQSSVSAMVTSHLTNQISTKYKTSKVPHRTGYEGPEE